MTDIAINEALYVDPAAGHDKFYRTFAVGEHWLTQYGRNGQIGTFTKPVAAGSHEKAVAAADKKMAAKIKKGYQPHRSGALVSQDTPSLDDPSWLDALTETLPAGSGDGTVGHSEPAPVALEDLETVARQDVTDDLIERLDSIGRRSYTPPDPAAAPLRPMLAEATDDQGFLDIVDDDEWVVQFKYDGDRVLIVVDDGSITVLNRQGTAKTRGISSALLAPFTALHRGRWVFDGEIVDRTLVLFDLVTAESADDSARWIGPEDPFSRRYGALAVIVNALVDLDSVLDEQAPALTLATNFADPTQRLRAHTVARREQREGLILRDRRSPYHQGRRSPALRKYKFVNEADVIVTALADDRESAQLSVDDGHGNPVIVGSASTIGKGEVLLGDVWTVRFLYVMDPAHPRMVQPRLVRRRTDKLAAECLLDQFAHAGTDRKV